jgi:hypothetical protein
MNRRYLAGVSIVLTGLLFSTPILTAPAAAQTTAPAPDNIEAARQQLTTLQKMLDEKLISPPEYEAARAKIMASIGATTPAVPTVVATPAPAAPAPAPAAPALVPAPAPPPPPAPALLPTFAGRWSIHRTRVDTLPDGKTLETPENPLVWVVGVVNGTVTVQREEEVVHFGHHVGGVELVPQTVPGAKLAGNVLTFTIQEQNIVHEHVNTTVFTYVLALGPANALAGTYAKDTEYSDPRGVIKSHEAGKVDLTRLPG